MAAIGREYEEFLGDRCDQVGQRRKLLLALHEGKKFKVLKGVKVLHSHHSDRYSPFEAEFLLELVNVVDKVELKLAPPPYVPRENLASIRGYSSLGGVMKLAALDEGKMSINWQDPDNPERPECPAALHYVTNYLFDPKPKIAAPEVGDALSLLEVPTLYHEAEEVGRRLKRRLIKTNSPQHRLAVAVPDMATYLPALQDVSRRFQLQFRRRRGDILVDQAPVASVLSLLALFESQWELQRIIKILTNPYFDFGLGEIPLERFYSSGIIDNRGESGAFHKLQREGERSPIYKELVVLKNLRAKGETLSQAEAWEGFESAFFRILNELKWGADPKGSPIYRENEKDPSFPELKAQVMTDKVAVEAFWGVTKELFTALKASKEAPAPTLEIFQLLLTSSLNIRLPEPFRLEEGIYLLNYQELHGAFFDELFLMGLNDRVFPQAKAESSYFPESFIVSLEGILGRRLWSSASERYQGQEEILVHAISQAKKVTLSWHRMGDNEKAKLPAPVVASIVGMFPKKKVEHEQTDGELEQEKTDGELKLEKTDWPLPPKAADISDKLELWLYLSKAYSSASQSEAPEEFIKNFGKNAEELWVSMDRRRDTLKRNAVKLIQSKDSQEEGDGGEEKRKDTFGRHKTQGHNKLWPIYLDAWLRSLDHFNGLPVLSVKTLTNYVECPRRFWYADVLKLREWGAPKSDFNWIDQGIFAHRVLELFLNPSLERHPSFYGRERLSKILEEVEGEYKMSSQVGRRLVFESTLDKMKTIIYDWHGRKGGKWEEEILALEWPFDLPERVGGDSLQSPKFTQILSKGKDQPFLVEMDPQGDSFYLRGRIDRIDALAKDKYRIVDYKLSRSAKYKSPKRQDPIDPLFYPSILYSLVIEERLKRKGREEPVVEARLEFLEHHKDGQYLEVPKADSTVFSKIYEKILERDIRPTEDDKVCEKCNYRYMCQGGA
jgi:CRISPR/Cas system-associated exonuclease Cas4 (RecB family)